MLDLKGKRFCIFGLQGSGKTVLAKYLLKHFSNHLVVDFLKEYQGFNRYLPQSREYGQALFNEMNQVCKYVIEKAKPDLFLIDEANRVAPSRKSMPPELLNLNDFNRHYGIGLGFIARRPVQLATDLVELSHYLFIFKLTGKNDLQYLDYIKNGLSDAVASIQGHEFILYYAQEGLIKKMPPVPLT